MRSKFYVYKAQYAHVNVGALRIALDIGSRKVYQRALKQYIKLTINFVVVENLVFSCMLNPRELVLTIVKSN